MQDTKIQLQKNIRQVQEELAEAALRCGRQPGEVTLIAVSKTHPLPLIEQAAELGLTNFGENRIQEAQEKIEQFHPQGVFWHLIGHLQSNKASKAARLFDSIESVDSVTLAQHLNNQAEKLQRNLPILLQVNVAGEASKSGVALEEAEASVEQILTLPALTLQGFMTIAPLVADPEEARPVFQGLRVLRDRLQEHFKHPFPQLSMGMSADYRVAIAEGATIVRIGRAIFGQRPAPEKEQH
jgi:pyridoxal phosphate enzyme (YggS family)